MGSWSTNIMGGDGPLDVKDLFEERFASKPTADEAIAFISTASTELHEDELVKQVTGFLVMERESPMSDELRSLIVEGIDAEIAEGATEWSKPEERIAVLQQFRQVVRFYPAEGGKVALPRQVGLFECIMGSRNADNPE